MKPSTATAQRPPTGAWSSAVPAISICFAAGEFVRADDGVFHDGEKAIPVAYFCSPQHTPDDLMRSFGRTRDMLAWMTAKLRRPFPFPKYYQWAAPGISGAMENISLVSWDERFVLDSVLAAGVDASARRHQRA